MKQKILELLAEICETEEILENPETDLFEENYLDSMGFAEFLVELEEKLGVVIAPSEVERSDINTPEKIVNLVMEKI